MLDQADERDRRNEAARRAVADRVAARDAREELDSRAVQALPGLLAGIQESNRLIRA
jgi:hypothetical protein